MKLVLSAKGKVNKDLTLKQLKKVLFRSVVKMHQLAVMNAPVDTGRLKNSINIIPFTPGQIKYLLVAGVEYAEAIEFGTSPHIIKPLNKQSLKFKSGNQVVFSKKVLHPGTEAQPFLRPALDQVKNVWVKRYMKQLLGKQKV